MSKLELIEELFAYPEQSFTKHLDLKDNHRILFSGRYGIGKTAFLDYFFKSSEKAKDYNAVHIFPVNYQIANNEDILEHIKYDIIAHLLSVEEIEFEKIDPPAYKTVPLLLSKKPAELLAPLLHFFGGAGKVYENYEKLFGEVYAVYEKQQKDEKESLLKYLQQAEQRQRSLYENDFYTDLIAKLLLKWKQEKDAENVLVIDDLDRIDPAHAFRLFNIFSAHFDHKEEHLNKFGFDKVIFVCDLTNIRNIFASNYGSKVDFSGYVDKFYSKEVFEFDNLAPTEKVIDDIVTNLIIVIENNEKRPADIYKKPNFKQSLTSILRSMYAADGLNLRAIFKFHKQNKIILKCRGLQISSRETVLNTRFFGAQIIDILIKFLGSVEDLKIAIRKCKSQSLKYMHDLRNEKWLEGAMIATLCYENYRNTVNDQELKIEKNVYNYRIINKSLDIVWADVETNKEYEPWSLIERTITYLQEIGYYKS